MNGIVTAPMASRCSSTAAELSSLAPPRTTATLTRAESGTRGVSLYHYRARMYDAVAGRFCSRDPIGFEGSKWNLFEYTNGMPLVRVDPSGKAAPMVVVAIIGVAAAVLGHAGCLVLAGLHQRSCNRLNQQLNDEGPPDCPCDKSATLHESRFSFSCLTISFEQACGGFWLCQ